MSILTIAQIVVSCALIVLILLQERESGVSGLFGGGEGGGIYAERRGLQKIIFVATIMLLVAFAVLALLNLVLRTS